MRVLGKYALDHHAALDALPDIGAYRKAASARLEATRCVMAAMCFRVGDSGSAVSTASGEIAWEHSLAGGAS